ncbi:MAG: hypothetical protein QM496_21700 [Verrucomicrobiota bacterium]
MNTIQILLSLVLLASTSSLASALEYEKDIMPIFKKKCFKCHSDKAKKPKGGLRFDDPAKFHGRFEKDELVQPGNPKMSNLYYSLTRPRYDKGAMPPEDKGKQLTEEEVLKIRNWIIAGAPINGTRGKRGKLPKEEKSQDKSTLHIPREREWTNKQGKTILATFLKIEADSAWLRLKNGKIYPYPINQLSEKSQDLLKKLDSENKIK